MSKKHFIALADALREDYKDGRIPDAVLCSLIGFMRSQNSAFMSERWLSYLKGDCGPNGGAIKK